MYHSIHQFIGYVRLFWYWLKVLSLCIPLVKSQEVMFYCGIAFTFHSHADHAVGQSVHLAGSLEISNSQPLSLITDNLSIYIIYSGVVRIPKLGYLFSNIRYTSRYNVKYRFHSSATHQKQFVHNKPLFHFHFIFHLFIQV